MSITIREFTDEYTEARKEMGVLQSIEISTDAHSVVLEEWDDGAIVAFWGSANVRGVVRRGTGFLAAQVDAIGWIERGSMGWERED